MACACRITCTGSCSRAPGQRAQRSSQASTQRSRGHCSAEHGGERALPPGAQAPPDASEDEGLREFEKLEKQLGSSDSSS
jgi:hypothetical protein